MAYVIRPYRDDDAEALSELCLASIREIGRFGYNPLQIAAWAGRHPNADRYRERVAGGHAIFVASDESDAPVGYARLEPDGHLDHLYCHPQHTRQGLADELLAAAKMHATTLGLHRLFTEASELARGAFERAGYEVTHRRDFEIEHAGRQVPIHNYAMEKSLV